MSILSPLHVLYRLFRRGCFCFSISLDFVVSGHEGVVWDRRPSVGPSVVRVIIIICHHHNPKDIAHQQSIYTQNPRGNLSRHILGFVPTVPPFSLRPGALAGVQAGLALLMSRMYQEAPKEYRFYPETWVLPNEMNDFRCDIFYTVIRNTTLCTFVLSRIYGVKP